MCTLNNRERFLKTMRFEPVDHPPLHLPGPWAATRRRWEQEGLPKGVDLHEYFEVERCYQTPVGIETMLEPAFDEIILEETDEFTIKINQRGVKEQNFKDGNSMPEFLEYPIKGRESLEWLREKLNPSTPARFAENWLETARQQQQNGHIKFINGGMYFAFLNEHMGTDLLMITYFDDPEFIHEVNDMLCTLCEQALAAALPEFCLDCIAYHEDMAYKNASLISPDMFREFMTPYYKRIRKFADRFDIDIQYMDSDGNVWELIPLWLECGINLVSPMEVAAGMDVVKLRKEFGRDLLMNGGFDKRILAAGKKEIKAELERIRPVVEEGGYIPGIDHGTPFDVSFENCCYYVKCLKGMYGMK